MRITFFFFFQAEDGIRDLIVTGVQTCALPICRLRDGGLVGLELREVGGQDGAERGRVGGQQRRARGDRGGEPLDPRLGGGQHLRGAVPLAVPVVDPADGVAGRAEGGVARDVRDRVPALEAAGVVGRRRGGGTGGDRDGQRGDTDRTAEADETHVYSWVEVGGPRLGRPVSPAMPDLPKAEGNRGRR